jgi:cytochrome c oxidase cbb3-type subunit I/II
MQRFLSYMIITPIIGTVLSQSDMAQAQVSLAQSQTTQQLIASGRESFVRNCAGCHGDNAQGAGPGAAMLNPKPRNLVAGAFKFRSTPTGTLPTNADLMRTIDQGVLGTSMPSYRLMSQTEKFALVTYIQSLRPDWKQSVGSPYHIPSPPTEIFAKKTPFLEAAAQGQKIFAEACVTCHGNNGQGDGPGAEGLVDADNNPIKPATLTAAWIKSGRSAKDVFKAITTGLDGSPMPSFGDVYTEAERWQLTAFVFYLRGKGQGVYAPDQALPSLSTKTQGRVK